MGAPADAPLTPLRPRDPSPWARPTRTQAVEPRRPLTLKGPGGLDAAAIRRAWPDVLAKIFETSRGTWTFVSQNARVLDYDGERLVLGTATGRLLNAFRSGGRTEHVRQALIDVRGRHCASKLPMDGTGEGSAPRRGSRRSWPRR